MVAFLNSNNGLTMTGQYEVQQLSLKDIFYDPNFNCRGEFATHEIIDLARDIKERGLDSPVVVRPYHKADGKYKWHLIAGHRRYKAIEYNYRQGIVIPKLEMGMIPAFVRMNVDEMEARRFNLRENLHRKNLNPLQEASALKYFLDCHGPTGSALFTDEELAGVFGQSRGWVQNRRALLKLPAEIQEAAASGLLTSEHIKKLSRMSDRGEQFALVRKIKDAHMRGEKVNLTPSIRRAGDALKSHCRSTTEQDEMSGLIYDMMGPNLATRFSAWSRGIISTVALLQTVKEECEEKGIEYKAPDFIRAAVVGAA